MWCDSLFGSRSLTRDVTVVGIDSCVMPLPSVLRGVPRSNLLWRSRVTLEVICLRLDRTRAEKSIAALSLLVWIMTLCRSLC